MDKKKLAEHIYEIENLRDMIKYNLEGLQLHLDKMIKILNEAEPEPEPKPQPLPFPYSSGIEGSKHSHMRELRIQHAGDPYRILYAFDPTRSAILLIGGMKTGDERWYDKYIPIADKLYDKHLETIRKEGLI